MNAFHDAKCGLDDDTAPLAPRIFARAILCAELGDELMPRLRMRDTRARLVSATMSGRRHIENAPAEKNMMYAPAPRQEAADERERPMIISREIRRWRRCAMTISRRA